MKKQTSLFILVAMFIAITLNSCEKANNTQKQGEQEQELIMAKARRAYPTPQVDNFLTRKNVIKWMERMDTPNKLFYIYIVADNGAIIGYYVAQYRPVSTATYLTPTQKIVDRYEGDVVVNSPALDGTYYGDGGASQQYFFFDAETDAFIELQGLNYILQDQPLSGLNVPKLTIEVKNKK